MELSRDDVVHKSSHEMKMHRQNQLKYLALVYFIVLYRLEHKKVDAVLVQCPFNVHSNLLFKRMLENIIPALNVTLCVIYTSTG